MTDQTPDVHIVEVGPRDGLQNEKNFVSTTLKIEWINELSQTGLRSIETTSFVNPDRIPQLADSFEVYQHIQKSAGICYSALIPNLKGMQKALEANIQSIAIFTAASESFNQRNINCSIDESIQRFIPVIELAQQHQIPIRAYISCALACPYEGYIAPEKVLAVAQKLQKFQIDDWSLSDTIGASTPKQTKDLLRLFLQEYLPSKTSMHFHDTYGQAIANVYAALEMGVKKFDSAIAGLGGCPYARGATGNLATEDLLYLLHGLGLSTGVDIYKVVTLGDKICKTLDRPNQSKVARALLGGSISA
jgi:hydroxymethylglutaryl-CoA lyase